MNVEDAKQIRIVDYLHSLGHNPIKQQCSSLWYNSPFRQEQEPSFKVDLDRNLWYDFKTRKGGGILAFVQELYQCVSLPYLLNQLEEQRKAIRSVSFSFPRLSSSHPSFQHLEVKPLSTDSLVTYLRGRGINTKLAQKECREVRFENNGKWYFAIGFLNVAGGYEIRNEYLKGCISPQDITHIRPAGEPKEICYVFGEFMDYLSFLTARQKSSPTSPLLDEQDYLILNSVCNLPKALDALGNYKNVHCFLGNDETGWRITREICAGCGSRTRVDDASHIYSGYTSYNAYLCDRLRNETEHLGQQSRQRPDNGDEPHSLPKRSKGVRM